MRNAGGGGVSGFGMSKSPIGMLKGAQHGVMSLFYLSKTSTSYSLVYRCGWVGPGLSHAPSGSGKGGFTAHPWNMRGSGAFTLRLSKDSGGIGTNMGWSTRRERFRLWRLGYE